MAGEATETPDTGLTGGDEPEVKSTADQLFPGDVKEKPEGEPTDKEKPEGGEPEDPEKDPEEGDPSDKEEPEGAPDSYEFTLPDEDAFVGDGVKEMMKELGLTQEQAQKLVDAHFKDMEGHDDEQANAWEDMKAEWWDEAKNDPDIGGASFDENVALARKGLKEFASERALEVLQVTGADHHPEIIKMFRDLGKALSEDKVLTGSSTNPQVKSAAQHLFPSMQQE